MFTVRQFISKQMFIELDINIFMNWTIKGHHCLELGLQVIGAETSLTQSHVHCEENYIQTNVHGTRYIVHKQHIHILDYQRSLLFQNIVCKFLLTL